MHVRLLHKNGDAASTWQDLRKTYLTGLCCAHAFNVITPSSLPVGIKNAVLLLTPEEFAITLFRKVVDVDI